MQKTADKRKLACPRCGESGSLTGRNDYYGSYLGCLICGWHGEPDENGYPVMVHIPPPPIRRRRRRRKGAANEPATEPAKEPATEPASEPGA